MREPTPAERDWVDQQVEKAPPLTEQQARIIAALYGDTERAAS